MVSQCFLFKNKLTADQKPVPNYHSAHKKLNKISKLNSYAVSSKSVCISCNNDTYQFRLSARHFASGKEISADTPLNNTIAKYLLTLLQ